MTRFALIAVAALASLAHAQVPASKPLPPSRDYYAFVGSEGNDEVALVRLDASGARVVHKIRMGTNPTELVGPHGVAVSPDGRYYYVSTAHGTPYGSLWKYSTVGDSLVGRVQLGAFPATVQVSPDGAYVWVVNFNLYGDMITSSVSVVYGPQMVEVARIPTCVMPHGSRLNSQGTRHYSACMMNDALIEIDARTMSLSRHFMLTKGMEHGSIGAPGAMPGMSHGTGPMKPSDITCSPTWAQPSPDGASVFVACNKSNDIAEIDVDRWTLKRRIPAGDGVYNLAITRDGKLLVGTNKRGQSVSVIDVASGKELARIATLRKVASGVAISPDDRYAFVTVEGVGAQPGTVEIIDLAAFTRVASVDVGPQAGGIDVWDMQRVR